MLDNKGFDEWSKIYDEHVEEDKFPFIGYKKVLFSLLELVEPINDLKVLDVGIGTGGLAADLAKRGCLIYGIDFSAMMLKTAKTRIPNGNFNQVDVSKNYLGSFSNQKFDRIISSYFSHHLNTNQKIDFIQKAINQNLSIGGKIIIADIAFYSKNDFKNGQNIFSSSWDQDEYYLCYKTFSKLLNQEGINSKYNQISDCAGIMIIDKIYQGKSIKEYQASYNNPIKVIKGTKLNTTKKESEWPGWIWCTDSNNYEGWIPERYLQIENDMAISLRAYNAKELTITINEILHIYDEECGWFWCKNKNDEYGWIPKENIELKI
ncbi:MAG: methyltransferase domain-containing protein [Oligoflexia bacterium]|nr:methyltransferase domain-containing protein [Oligoflexia bacterium]